MLASESSWDSQSGHGCHGIGIYWRHSPTEQKRFTLCHSYLPSMRSLILLSMAILLCSSGALGQTNNTSFDELMASALQSLVVDSSAKLESYRFSMEMEQKMDLVNLSSGDTQKLNTRSFGYGMANMTDRALKLSMAALTYAEGDEDNSSAMALEEYLINDTLYLKVDGNWTAMKMPGVADAWSQQNTMTQQLKMFNQSRLSLIGSEVVEGVDCYKVRAEMDMSTMADQLSGEVTSIVPMPSMNYYRTLPQYEIGRLLLDHQRYSSSQEDGCTGDLHSDATVFRPECQRIRGPGNENKC